MLVTISEHDGRRICFFSKLHETSRDNRTRIKLLAISLNSTGGTLLASLRPLLVCVCSNPVKYSDPNLRASASLALAKFMLVRYVTLHHPPPPPGEALKGSLSRDVLPRPSKPDPFQDNNGSFRYPV